MLYFIVRGAIKKFSAWPSSAQNKIKIVYASYSSKAQNTTCTIWLLGYKYSVHFSGRRLLAVEMKKRSYAVFVPLHALLFWFRIEVVDTRFILNNELWNKFLLGHIGIVEEVLQKLVHISGVSILDTVWQTLCSYAEIMHKIFVAQKSHCACRVLMLGTIRSKYYFTEYFLIFPRSLYQRSLQVRLMMMMMMMMNDVLTCSMFVHFVFVLLTSATDRQTDEHNKYWWAVAFQLNLVDRKTSSFWV